MIGVTMTAPTARFVFFLSDSTGITAETLGSSLLSQFDDSAFESKTLPFVSTAARAHAALEHIDQYSGGQAGRPIVFSTAVAEEVRAVLRQGHILLLDLFDTLLPAIEAELGRHSNHAQGRRHGIANQAEYETRIDAMNFALSHDDGLAVQNYDRAEIILLAPSRCGKTPVCLYLAMQYGIYVANYPLVEDDLESRDLPRALAAHQSRLYGLIISPQRLQKIRSERLHGSRYADFMQISYELRQAQQLYRRHGLPYVDTTERSIEELAAVIMKDKQIQRRAF